MFITPDRNPLTEGNNDGDSTNENSSGPELPPQQLSKGEAVEQISSIIYQCQVMGANDSEIPTLNQLVEDVLASKIPPQDAVTKAHGILNSKQSYH